MNPTRVLIAVDSLMLQSLVEALLSGRADIVIVDKVTAEADAVEAVRRKRPDVLILLHGGRDLPQSYHGLFLDLPTLRILALGRDATSAVVFGLRLHRTTIEEVAPDNFLNAILSAHGMFDD